VSGREKKTRRASPPLYALAFLLFLSLWTWKLLEPNPVPEAVRAGLGVDWGFVLAKCLHLGGYAFLTALGTLAFPLHRPWVVVFMLLHAVGTEIGQTFVPNRSGSVRDVLIDWCGIALGVLALRRLGDPFSPPREDSRSG
jgi:hypothetical protein